MKLFPYQIIGADWLSSGEPFLFDEMGLGKTAQAIEACRRLGVQRVGVIAPAIARPVWRREFQEWGSDITPDVLSFAQARTDRWDERTFDRIIVDEGHNLGNIGSQQTRTPMRGHPAQLWPMFHTLKGDAFPESYWDWTRQYCVYGERVIGGRVVRDIIGGKNLGELADRLKGHFLRRKAEDVLDLPDLRIDTIPVPEGSMIPDLRDLDLALIVRSIVEGNVEFQDQQELTRLRRATGLAKARAVVELMESAAEPTVLFAYHHDVIDILCEALACDRITGKESDAEREEAIDRFQSGKSPFLVCQIVAASTVITLTKGTWVVLVEPLWSPTDNLQAIKRCLRIGSERPVRASFITLSGTVDEAVMRVLARKTEQIALTLGEVA